MTFAGLDSESKVPEETCSLPELTLQTVTLKDKAEVRPHVQGLLLARRRGRE